MIEELYHRTPDATIKTRCQIILLEASPMSVPQIAQVIFYSEDTVACCIHEFHQSRWERLLPSRDLRTSAQGHAGLYVVVDTYRIHFAKPVLAKFSAHAEQIELVTRPSYSPQLNPARRFWKQRFCKVTHHTFFQTIDRLLDAVTGFRRSMAACPQTVRAARRMSRVSLISCLRSREQDDTHPAGEGGC